MTIVAFKSNSGSVKVNTEDMPKIAEKSKEISETMKQGIDDMVTTKAQAREMKRKYTISKIKIDKNFHAMTILYGGSNKKGAKETTFTGYEEMIAEKYFLIQSLKENVCEILKFPSSWVDELVITGISLNYDTEVDALRGMVITLQKEIEGLNCPLNINTPFIKFSQYIDDHSPFPVEESTWDYEVSETVQNIIDNAYLYMCGDTKTQQQKLFA